MKFNGTLATPTNWTNTAITVPVPAGATTGGVVVRVGTVDSNARTFTVLPSPTISNLSITSGLPGTAVTITGTNFGATKGSSTVKFNGTTASTTSWSATSIGAIVPATASTGNVVVTVSGVQSAGVLFTVPTLISIDVVPYLLTLPINSQQQYKALGQYSDGIARDITSSVTWSSADESVASVDAAGLVFVATDEGTANVSATMGAISGVTDSFGSTIEVQGSQWAERSSHIPHRYAVAGRQGADRWRAGWLWHCHILSGTL